MVNHFNEFANLCFERFGNRVKYWITFNNPWVGLGYVFVHETVNITEDPQEEFHTPDKANVLFGFWLQSVAVEGYETGEHAPGLRLRGTGAYRAAHHIIKVRGCRFVKLSKLERNESITKLKCISHRHMLRFGTRMTPSGGGNNKVNKNII